MIPYHSELLLQCINSVSSLNPSEEWSNIVVLNFQTYIIINMTNHSFGIKSMIYILYGCHLHEAIIYTSISME
jgi:hypothetical protein